MDKELRIYEILYGGICMSLPIFFCPGELSLWRLLLPMAAAFCLYEAALRRKSILFYLLLWAAFGVAGFEAGRDLIEKACRRHRFGRRSLFLRSLEGGLPVPGRTGAPDAGGSGNRLSCRPCGKMGLYQGPGLRFCGLGHYLKDSQRKQGAAFDLSKGK